MAPCTLCGTEHPILRHHMTGHLEPDNCIKALAKQLADLKAGGATLGGEAALETLAGRVSSLESLLTQKVCFTTFEEAVRSIERAMDEGVRALEARVKALEDDQVIEEVTVLPTTDSAPAPTPAGDAATAIAPPVATETPSAS